MIILLYPYMEETIIFNDFNFSLSPNGIVWVNNANSVGANAPTSIVVTTMLCPSDGLAPPVKDSVWGTFVKGNYLAFVGNIDYASAIPPYAPIYLRSVMGLGRCTRIGEITDGTSHTMVLGEYLVGTTNPGDFRGEIWVRPALLQPNLYNFRPQQRFAGCRSADRRQLSHVLLSRTALNLPCTSAADFSGNGLTAGSRSRHAGGVNVVLADGSVQFIRDEIAIGSWRWRRSPEAKP